jgi:DNA-binding response OmpR family regulator
MPESATILLVDDEESIQKLLTYPLEHEGFHVVQARDGEEALQRFEENAVDLVILDIMLPKLDGLEVCRRLRARSAVPILMLTARDGIQDRVRGLDSGADDYLVKPFALAELLARVRALSRRARMGSASEAPLLEVGDLVLDLRSREARRGTRRIELTAREFALLETLMRHPAQVMTRSQLLDSVWSYDAVTESNIVDIYIHYLRNKVDKGFDKKLLRTVRGMGYAIRAE